MSTTTTVEPTTTIAEATTSTTARPTTTTMSTTTMSTTTTRAPRASETESTTNAVGGRDVDFQTAWHDATSVELTVNDARAIGATLCDVIVRDATDADDLLDRALSTYRGMSDPGMAVDQFAVVVATSMSVYCPEEAIRLGHINPDGSPGAPTPGSS